uniref:Uncharacterized protein n=1 Tax=Anguilla anguilla TaxID=7936 RepID=A0A0E9SDS4_ANGAN
MHLLQHSSQSPLGIQESIDELVLCYKAQFVLTCSSTEEPDGDLKTSGGLFPSAPTVFDF